MVGMAAYLVARADMTKSMKSEGQIWPLEILCFYSGNLLIPGALPFDVFS
jgi:hypothetical protein